MSSDKLDELHALVEQRCKQENANNNALCRAVEASNMAYTEPISCMLDLIDGSMNCGQKFPQEKLDQAYQIYTQTTGFTPLQNPNVFEELQTHSNEFQNYNVLYYYVPIAILFIILIWMMVGFGLMAWPVGIYISMFVIVVLFAFAAAYRLHTTHHNNNRFMNLQQITNQNLQAYQNSIAYIPQGLFAVACALTCEGTTGCWQCNNNSSSSCTSASSSCTSASSSCSSADWEPSSHKKSSKVTIPSNLSLGDVENVEESIFSL
jgi:uncharacterized membrane protein YecN with MAPEG domain